MTSVQVSTPIGTEAAPEGWDDEDTVIMTQKELDDLLTVSRPSSLNVACSVIERKGSRPALRIDIT